MSTVPQTRFPLPAPNTPVVLQQRLAVAHAHLNACYADSVWSTAPLSENPSAKHLSIHWRNCREPFREELRLVAWTMVNGELRPTFLRDRANTLRARISADGIYVTVMHWMRMATWLEGRGIRTLADCNMGVLHEYGTHLRDEGNGRGSVSQVLTAVTRLWAFDELSGRPAGIARPPWDEFGADDYLPASTYMGGENTTEVLAEETMGPLLVWAMRVVDDFADDILAASAESKRLTHAAKTNTTTPAGLSALRAYMDRLIASDAPIPSVQNRGKTGLARQYIAALTGASATQVDNFSRWRGVRDLARQRPGSCPLNIPVTGLVHGLQWREALDFDESPGLVKQLGTACFIVIAYLTGMRPGEVLGLRAGCCPDLEHGPGDKTGRYLIRGLEYKNARDQHGNHLSSGVEREAPWVAIAPVVNAIRILERIVPDGHLLFDHVVHDPASRPGTGALTLQAMRDRVEDFVTWANNEAATHHLTGEVITPDPYGTVGTARFRRTLAWHIARRPGGLVALAIQYGHLRTAVTGGYASRSRDGIHTLLDVETVRAVGDTITHLHASLETGGTISGPAARRAIRAATSAPEFAGSAINETTARRYFANDGMMVYDNPNALLMCVYKRDRALCHRDGVKDTPTLDRCVSGCSNIARTDEHAEQLRQRADALDKRAAHVPPPLADRLLANANRLRSLAADHERTRITVQEAGQ
ncbi:integrase [Streptomyces mirabilis]|uniref:integrase n=1 Tax=Streptomyces mirabilis TaxID=68239 RepID=UPI0036CFE0A0